MTKRICLLLLAVLLLLSAAACGKNPDPPSSTAADPGTQSTAEPAAPATEAPVTEAPVTEAPELPDLPEKNYNGAEIKVYAEGNLTTDFTDLYLDEESAATAVSEALHDRKLHVEERLGVKLNIVPNIQKGDMAAFERSVAAGAGEYDLVSGIATFITSSVRNGRLYNLNDLPYIDLSKGWYLPYLNSELAVIGRQYTASGYFDMATFARTSAVYFSTKLAEDYKVGDLYALVEKNEWTYDRMLDIAAGCAKDVNGDGAMTEADQFGLCGGYNMNSMLITTTGYRFTELDENGVRKPTGYNDLLLDFNTMLLDTYESSWYYNCYAYGGTNHYNDVAKPGFMENKFLFLLQDVYWAKDFSAGMDDYGILPLPKYAKEQKDYVAYCRPATSGVPIDAKDPECSAAVLEALNYESKLTILPAYVNRSLSSRYASSPEASRMMEIIFANVACDFAQTWYDAIGVSPNLHNSIGINRDYVSYYEGVKGQLSAKLAEICNTLGKLQ